MKTAATINLLHTAVALPDLQIDQAMDIAEIPQSFNEKRLSAFISHLSGDPALAGKLTAQERYYYLLNHQAVAKNNFSDNSHLDEHVIDTIESEVPEHQQVGDMLIHHLRGAHACVLEGICENAYDWVRGRMACQISGDLTSVIGGDADTATWDALPASMTDAALNDVIQERVGFLAALSVDNFNLLFDAYYSGDQALAHFVVLGCDNNGLTVMNQVKKGGDGHSEPSRFLTLDNLQGIAKVLAECLA